MGDGVGGLLWQGYGGVATETAGSSGSNNLIEKLNGEIFDVGGIVNKKLTVASLFAVFLSGGRQLWPLNLSLGWGEARVCVSRGNTVSKNERANM